MKMPHCCVVACTNDSRYGDRYLQETGKELRFHQFPVDTQRRKDWIVAIRRDEGPNFQVARLLVRTVFF
jgi:hypothetical protein